MSTIITFIKSLNGYDFSILLIVLSTIDTWAGSNAGVKSSGLVSGARAVLKKYSISLLPMIIWIITEQLYEHHIMTIGGKIVLFIVMVLITFWLSFSEFISITSFLAIAEPKAFKWAQKFAINYALPEIQKKMIKLDIKSKATTDSEEKK